LKTGLTAVELEHCREAAIIQGGLFEFTSRYLSPDRFEEYLALYALKQVLELIPAAHVDETVIWAKLKWWSEELAAEPDSVSRHPVLRALWASGARAKIDNSLLQALLNTSISRIDMAPDSDENDMYERLAALGASTIESELALDEAHFSNQCVRSMAAASGMFDVLSGYAKDDQPQFDRIPLSKLAELNLSAAQLEQQPAELTKVIGQLAGCGLDWYSQGLQSLQENRAGRHLQLRWAMENRRLREIKKNAAGFLENGHRYGPADAWFAWRFMRRLN
jgi:phytoene/squalene synthetase